MTLLAFQHPQRHLKANQDFTLQLHPLTPYQILYPTTFNYFQPLNVLRSHLLIHPFPLHTCVSHIKHAFPFSSNNRVLLIFKNIVKDPTPPLNLYWTDWLTPLLMSFNDPQIWANWNSVQSPIVAYGIILSLGSSPVLSNQTADSLWICHYCSSLQIPMPSNVLKMLTSACRPTEISL